MMLVFLVVCLVIFLIQSLKAASDDAEATAPTLVFVGLYNVFCWTAMLVAMVIVGAKANDQFNRHRTSIIRHRIQIREFKRIDHASFDANDHSIRNARVVDEETAEECDDLLDATMQALESMSYTYPVRVMGMRAEFALASSIVTLVGSAVLFTVQELLGGEE
jgi:hypothetical protein